MEADGELPEGISRDVVLTDVLNEALGLGPLEAFLANEDISEIMVNHANQIYIERKGKLFLSEKIFSSNQAVLGVIERIVAPIGRGMGRLGCRGEPAQSPGQALLANQAFAAGALQAGT